MSNLLEETKEFLQENEKTMKDVVWIGTEEVEIPIEVFERLADREYDDGFGSQSVAVDLVVCGSDWWLERHEYDGSEWWEFKKTPVRPGRKVIPTSVVDDYCMWASLKEMNHPLGKYEGSGVPFDWEGMVLEDKEEV